MTVLRNIATLGLVVMMAAGLSGCSDSSFAANQGITPVGEFQDAQTMAQDFPQTIVADASVRLANVEVQVTTDAAPKPKVPISAPIAASPERQAPAVDTADGQQWIQTTMNKYGVYPDPGTRLVIGPMPSGCDGADGCTRFSYYPSTGVAFDYVITIRPGQLTEYLLFHEIGHAKGIRDECGADNFARSVLGPIPGHYC